MRIQNASRALYCFLHLVLIVISESHLYAQQYPFVLVPNSPKGPAALFEDSKGRLWVGAADDLQMFDGSYFYSLHTYGLPKGGVNDISEDSAGSIWIGAESGLYRWSGKHLDKVFSGLTATVAPLSSDYVLAAVNPKGEANIPSDDQYQPYRISIREGSKYEPLPTIMKNGFTVDQTGTALYICGTGWCELGSNAIASWRPGTAIKQNFHSVGQIQLGGRVLRDHRGCLWLRDQGSTRYRCPGNTRLQQLPNEVASSSGDFYLREMRDGRIFIPSDSILAIGRPGSFRVVRASNGYPNGLAMVESRDGTIWLSSQAGLYRFASPRQMEYWDERSGLEHPMAITRVGSHVFCGSSQGILTLSHDRTRWIPLQNKPDLGHVFQLSPGPNGTLMANGADLAMLAVNGSVIARHGSHIQGWHLVRMPDGTEWLAGAGVSRVIQRGSHFDLKQVLPIPDKTSIDLDMDYSPLTKTMWTCADEGLLSRSESGWKLVATKSDGLMDNCISIAALSNGDVWLSYFHSPFYAVARHLPSGKVVVHNYEGATDFVRVDSRGWLWRGTDSGIAVAEQDEAEKQRWLYPDGDPAVTTNQNAFFNDPDGSVWWGTNNSIFRYTPPADLLRPTETPQVFVSSFSVEANAAVLADAVLPIAYGAPITAHVGSTEFKHRSALSLRYRVAPDQTNWTESRSLDLPLGLIGAGAHSLEVQARVFSGMWSPTVTESFTVKPPLWLSRQFFLSGACLLGTTGLILLWYRQKRLAEATALPDLAAWRVKALSPELHELNGTLLQNRFEVKALIARGGFANVMDGYDRVQNRRCAIKIFRSEVSDKVWLQDQFAQEIAALSSIQHPNVVSIYSYGHTSTQRPYLVMEFIEGLSLREVLNAGPLPPGRAKILIAELSSALTAIHALNICHRDVKPENVMIRREQSKEEAVLIDFSIAIIKSAEETLHGLSRAAGSFDYMAPEQALGAGQPSSDVYSLARLIIEMLTGRRLSKLLPNAALDLPMRVRELPDLPARGLSSKSINLLAEALEFDPKNRPSSVASLVEPIINDLGFIPTL